MSTKPTMHPVTEKLHRILTPRLVVTIGTKDPNGRANIIPINNITSISTDPGMVIIAVYKPWITAQNLQRATGFTISVPQRDQLELIWKLGQKFSGYASTRDKIDEFRHHFDLDFSEHGPVLVGAQGWLECEIAGRPDDAGANHYLVIGRFTKAAINPDLFNDQISPINHPKPFMQWDRNNFSEASDVFSVDYYKDTKLG